MMSSYLLLVMLYCVVGYVHSETNYVVMVPSVARPGRTLDVSVQVFKEGSHQVYAKMVQTNIEERLVQIIANSSTTIEKQDTMGLLMPDELTSSELKVFVEITDPDGKLYQMNTSVTPTYKTLSVYIQTDKAVYKPGSLVQLRALAVYSDLLPYKGSLDIIITDPGESRIKQWLDVSDSSGVVSKELQLSDQPVMGKWSIEVITSMILIQNVSLSQSPKSDIGGHERGQQTQGHLEKSKTMVDISFGEQKEKKKISFTVMEYVLPKFDVKLLHPSHFWIEDENLKITVEARYTFGQPVKGQADVMINLQTYGKYEIEQYDMPTIQKTIELHKGKASVTLTGEELVSLAGTRKCYSSACYSDIMAVRHYALMQNYLSGRTIQVAAVVRETLTGKNFSTDGTVKVPYYPYVVTFMDFTPNTFKPGLPWIGMVQLKKVDNSPLNLKNLLNHKGEAEPLKVSMRCSVRGYLDDKKTEELPIDPSGFISLTYSPHENASYCFIEVQFKYATTSKSLSKFMSLEQNGLQVTLLDQEGPVQPGTTVQFKVSTTVSTDQIFIQFLSKSRIVNQMTHSEAEKKKEFYISVEMDENFCRRLAPSPRILIWMVTPAELIADMLDFTVDGAFSNKVSVNFSASDKEPGEEVSLIVEASPQSYVGVLAVDQSVLLLGGSNDFTQRQVLSDLAAYDSGSTFYRPYYGPYFCWWPIYRGGRHTSDLFNNAGLKVMTDSLVYGGYKYCPACAVSPDTERPGAPSAPVGAPGETGLRGPGGPQGEAGAPGSPGSVGSSGPNELPDMPSGPPEEDSEVLQEPDRVRTEFPETWLWQDFVAGPDGKVSLQTQVPDTITSWVASAFAIEQEDGLGIAPTTAKLTVAKPFFASLDLPYSMIRGEEVALKVTVFNYLPEDMNAVVTLKASEQFKVRHPNFIEPRSGEDIMKDVFIESGDGVLVSFWIVPTVLGDVPISVETRSGRAADALVRDILVEPEGELVENGHPILFALDAGDLKQTEMITIDYPDSLVEGSERALFTVFGDIMGPSLSGLDKLLRMPYGCGEQNMINFAPSIYILTYLKNTDTVKPEIEAKAIKFMESGYQRELSYRRKDGSFSAFGESDASGSSWLTAFVIRCFNQAKPYITVDQTIIDKAVEFISRNIGENGEFLDPGRVMNTRLQGGSSKGVSLTAYITAALLENKDDLSPGFSYMAESAIQSALRYLETQLEDIKEDPYALSLLTYTLTLGKSGKAAQALLYLDDLATTEGKDRYWKKEEEPEVYPYRWWYRPSSAHNVEMTAYALLTYTEKNLIVDGSKIVSWMAKQRNSLGGFRSTQDTVIALQAMSSFQALIGVNSEQDISIHLQVDDMERTFNTINKENALLLQSYEVPSAIYNVTIEATGQGLALLQMSIFYHQLQGESKEGLQMTVTSSTVNTDVVTEVCVSWVQEEQSGMVVIEMGQLTAYEPITTDLLLRYSQIGLKRFEVSNKKLVLYLDEVTVTEMCLSVTSVNVSPVSNLQAATVLGYQYYDPGMRQSVAYMPVGMNDSGDYCDICPDCCEGPVTTVAPEVIPPEGPCASNPCVNGGRCLDDLDMYKCQCHHSFKGTNCEEWIIHKPPKSLNIQDENGATTITLNCVFLATVSSLMLLEFLL